MSNLEALVCNLLKCGPADLAMLERVGFDWPDVIEATGWRGSSFTDMDFNSLMEAVVWVGISSIEKAIRERIAYLELLEKDASIGEEELTELHELVWLNPEEDIWSFHNFLDTHVWFKKNGSVYHKYMKDAIDNFEYNVGIEITGGEEDE